MKIYLTGVFIAFAINLIQTVVMFFNFFSTKNNNLKKIGLYYNPTAGTYTKEKWTWKGLFFLAAFTLIIGPLLSWLSVGYSVFVYLKAIINKVPVPEKIKEFNFKLSSIDLPKEKVREYVIEIGEFYGFNDTSLDDRTLDDADEDDPDLYVLEQAIEHDDWHREIRLNRPVKCFTMYSRAPDYDSQFTYVCEYKFIDNDLWTRTIEYRTENRGEEEYWDIKDNVVLELDVRNRMGKSRFDSPEGIENKIASLKEDVEWRKCKRNIIKYFIMFKHSDLFPEFELRKYLRSELERIKNGYKKAEDEINKLGGVIVKESLLAGMKPFPRIICNNELSEEEQVKVHNILLEDNISKFGISNNEFYEADELRPELTKYLAKLENS